MRGLLEVKLTDYQLLVQLQALIRPGVAEKWYDERK